MAIKKKDYMEQVFNQIRSGNIDTSRINFSNIENDSDDDIENNRMEQVFNQIRSGNIDVNKIDIMRSSNDETSEIDSSSWFKKSKAFEENGTLFSKSAKTILGTAEDIGTHLTKGLMNVGEGIGDLITYGRAQYNENKGNTEKANELRNVAQRNSVEELFNPIQEKVDENSILGNKSDSIVEGLGYVAGMTAIGVATGGAGAGVASAATTATTFSSAMGQGMSQAYQEGANDDEAWKFGVISGLAEAGSELFFGGLGKTSGALGLSKGITSIDDTIAKKVSETFKSTIAKNLSEYVIKAGAEGTEEIISGFIQALGQKATYKKDKDFWGELVKDQNLLEQFVAGAVTSAIAQVPGQNGIYKTTKNGRDFITGLTQNEAKVYDKELSTRVSEKTKASAIENAYNEQIKTQEKLGMELSEDDKNIIRQSIEEAYDSGRIKADKKLSSKLYDELEQNVRRDLEDGNISIDTIRNTIGENQDIGKDKLLQKSLYEEEQKNVAYQVQKTDNEKVNILYQSATDSGMNNNNITRKKVELVAKLTKDTDRQYKFVSPEQLKEMGYNENANGLINKETGEILINSRSENGLQAIIGHETTHIFDSTNEAGEYSKEYQDLQNYVIEYAKQKGIYEDKIKNITQAYGNILENEKQVNEELTADLIGDFLFNDSEFIEQLSTKNRNVFQKIYDYIKHSIKLATAGSKEARQLENIKYQFDKVYKTISEETNTDIKYSIAGIEAIKNVKNDETLYKDAMYSYQLAKKMAKQGKSNKEIIETTGWFKDDKGKLKFSFSDRDMELKNLNFRENNTYKLKDVLKHDTLFTFYPQLKYLEVEFKDLNKNRRPEDGHLKGSYNRLDKKIRLDINMLNSKINTEGTLIHEIQHAIQHIEKFTGGTSRRLGKRAYTKSFGEIEARDTAKRFVQEKYYGNDLSYVIPESAKLNRNILEKMKEGVYNYFNIINRGGYNEEVIETNQKDIGRNRTLVDGGIKESENNSGSFILPDNSKTKIQGLENYSVDEVKSNLRNDIREILDDNGFDDIEIVDLDLHGSRLRGTAKNNSDLDVVVQYNGDAREDTLFDTLNEEPIEIDGIKVDINPIQEDLKDYMKRSNEYDKEVLSKLNTQDNQGRKLSKQQEEYFKDTKVKDENGNIKTVYHRNAI